MFIFVLSSCSKFCSNDLNWFSSKLLFQIFEKTELNRFWSKVWFKVLLKWLELVLIKSLIKSLIKNKFKILKRFKFSVQFKVLRRLLFSVLIKSLEFVVESIYVQIVVQRFFKKFLKRLSWIDSYPQLWSKDSIVYFLFSVLVQSFAQMTWIDSHPNCDSKFLKRLLFSILIKSSIVYVCSQFWSKFCSNDSNQFWSKFWSKINSRFWKDFSSQLWSRSWIDFSSQLFPKFVQVT